MKKKLTSAAVGLALALGTFAAKAEDVADFYKGKIVTFVVGTPAGGGYDIYARLLSRYFAKHIPGNPTIIVQNMPGAGSVIAANYVYNIAPQDGTVILAATRTAAFNQLLGQPGPRYLAAKFNWLGSLNNEVGVMAVASNAPAKTVEEARKVQVIFGSPSSGGDGDVYPALMNNTVGTKFKLIRGYSGSSGVDLAIKRGEVHGQSESFSSMKQHFPDWRDSMRILVQLSLSKDKDLPNVPLIFDYIKPEFMTPGMTVETAETLWRMMLVQKVMGRPFAVGPNVPKDRVKALRTAFHAVLKDPEFLAEAEMTKNEINAVDGDEVQRLLETISSASPSDIAKLKDAITYSDEKSTGNEGAQKP